ncbi:hypothetical protein [Streptomyces alanosinicus]|uniref:Uncharacterized protein n=1 Tax=Streptomyces alanosinicus TaxID=68171 RepID=A0A918YS59_9ACTN|nr:hypothetical protein [Streptomyces alanosinicus]GHE14742.1 hypothetical protein GCM10010339_86770 [Streptomyces alanosinicus]
MSRGALAGAAGSGGGLVDLALSIRPELTKVVERVENYVATALPEPGLNTKVSLLEHRIQLGEALINGGSDDQGDA